MDLDNTVREDNLVMLKEGVSTFNADTNCQTEFKPHTVYRCNQLTNGKHKEYLIFGVVFSTDFDKYFEFAQTRILRDFETLSLINNGKVISRTAFGKLLDIHQYGRTSVSGFKIGYVSNSRELLYGFFPFFTGDTKANTIRNSYQSVLDIIEGNMDCVDEFYVQFGNCGIPISANPSSRLQVRDTFALTEKSIF